MSLITEQYLDKKYYQYFAKRGIPYMIDTYNMNKIKSFMSMEEHNAVDIFTYIRTYDNNIKHDDIIELMCHAINKYPHNLPRVNYECLNCTEEDIKKIKNSVNMI